MKIELIKQKFDDSTSFKFKPIKYCCEDLKNNPSIVLTDEYEHSCKHDEEEDGTIIPYFSIMHSEIVSSWGDEWQNDYYYKINHCPFCCEQIEISIVKEEDVSDIVRELQKERKEKWDKHYKTDSKKKAAELEKLVHNLDNKINYFYDLFEYDESMNNIGDTNG